MEGILRSSPQELKCPYFDHFLDFSKKYFFGESNQNNFQTGRFFKKNPELNELERVMTALKISSKNIEKQKS